MICWSKNIKELLPAFSNETLGTQEQERVRSHLASCEDCRTELALLQAMADETVTDPGEAFWAAMPGRIEREVRDSKENRKSVFSGFLTDVFVPRLRWAAAITVFIAVGIWLTMKSVPVHIAGNGVPEHTVMEEYLTAEPLNLAELSSTELKAAGRWAQNEFSEIGEEVGGDVPGITERDPLESVYILNQEELERLSELLEKQEQEIKNRINKKNSNKNTIG